MSLLSLYISFFIFLIIGILFFLIFNLLSLFSGAPYVKSKKRAREEMLKIAQVNTEEIIFDLGSGDGTLLIEAARRYEFKKAYGIEVNPILVFISKIRIRRLGLQNKIEVIRGNFLRENLSQATLIFTYLLPAIQRKLGTKLKRELKPGTRIISNAFTFPNLSLVKKIQYAELNSKRDKRYIREYIIE